LKIGIESSDWGYGPHYLKHNIENNRLEIVSIEKYKTALILITKSKNYLPLEDTPYFAMSNIRCEIPDPRRNIGSNWRATKEEALEEAKDRLDNFLKESIEFERGIEPKDAMKIGKKAQIEKWFNDRGISPNDYEILDDLSVIIDRDLDLYHRKNVTYFPTNNMTIKGCLDLDGTDVSELPDILIVRDWMDIRHTSIKTLPKGLSVGDDLVIRGTLITSISDKTHVGKSIFAYKDQLVYIPNHLKDKIKIPDDSPES
jgi:hypothetical protein